jgi:hypothetical protein
LEWFDPEAVEQWLWESPEATEDRVPEFLGVGPVKGGGGDGNPTEEEPEGHTPTPGKTDKCKGDFIEFHGPRRHWAGREWDVWLNRDEGETVVKDGESVQGFRDDGALRFHGVSGI